MCGPLDNSHWLIRGPDGKSGPSIYANVLIGGFPAGLAKSARGPTLNNNSLVSLLTAGIDTFVCLMTREEVREHEQSLGLLTKEDIKKKREEAEKNGGSRKTSFSSSSSSSSLFKKSSSANGSGATLSKMAMGEAEKEFEKMNANARNVEEVILGSDPPHYKEQLGERTFFSTRSSSHFFFIYFICLFRFWFCLFDFFFFGGILIF